VAKVSPSLEHPPPQEAGREDLTSGFLYLLPSPKLSLLSVGVNKREAMLGLVPPPLQAAYWKHPTTYRKDHT
jgi:hypothetical protein